MVLNILWSLPHIVYLFNQLKAFVWLRFCDKIVGSHRKHLIINLMEHCKVAMHWLFCFNLIKGTEKTSHI